MSCLTYLTTGHGPLGKYRLRFFTEPGDTHCTRCFNTLDHAPPLQTVEHIMSRCKHYWRNDESRQRFYEVYDPLVSVAFLNDNPDMFTYGDTFQPPPIDRPPVLPPPEPDPVT